MVVSHCVLSSFLTETCPTECSYFHCPFHVSPRQCIGVQDRSSENTAPLVLGQFGPDDSAHQTFRVTVAGDYITLSPLHAINTAIGAHGASSGDPLVQSAAHGGVTQCFALERQDVVWHAQPAPVVSTTTVATGTGTGTVDWSQAPESAISVPVPAWPTISDPNGPSPQQYQLERTDGIAAAAVPALAATANGVHIS